MRGGVEHCCLFLLLQSLSHSGWRASPKRLTRSSKFSSSLCKTQTRTDRQITGDYWRDIFTSSHDPNVLNIHLSYRGDKSSWFIWSFHLYTLRFPFQRDSGCMGGGSSSRHIFVRKCRDWEKKTWNKERNGTDASVSLKYAHRNKEDSQKYEYVKRKKCIFEDLLIYLLKLELNVKKAEANAVKILKYRQKRCRYTHQVAGFVSEVTSTVTVAVLSSILNRLHMSGVQTAEKYYYETIKKRQLCNC